VSGKNVAGKSGAGYNGINGEVGTNLAHFQYWDWRFGIEGLGFEFGVGIGAWGWDWGLGKFNISVSFYLLIHLCYHYLCHFYCAIFTVPIFYLCYFYL